MLSPVRKMFDGIAHRYDFLNHFLSLGRDIAWRKSCSKMVADLCRDQGRIELLDLCGGTGDFAGTFCRYNKNCGTPVVGDFSFGMLKEVARKGIKARVVQLDAMKMPFADGQFDLIVNGFGMRNLPDAKLGLMESYRVLRQGGYICFLEFFST
ncbi:MAG: class I SAM-dependent methyltransferase, partial [Fibrobacter sp.]|nr:class I SAM-dependent methyltransferase [Fibrobacter sp.]